mmetsp:Transcript_152/g.342  ORF Transcript_152/g.342 Transcript_152/m.342 type:complete len:250 (-) Transcript_152:349-1098(-)
MSPGSRIRKTSMAWRVSSMIRTASSRKPARRWSCAERSRSLERWAVTHAATALRMAATRSNLLSNRGKSKYRSKVTMATVKRWAFTRKGFTRNRKRPTNKSVNWVDTMDRSVFSSHFSTSRVQRGVPTSNAASPKSWLPGKPLSAKALKEETTSARAGVLSTTLPMPVRRRSSSNARKKSFRVESTRAPLATRVPLAGSSLRIKNGNVAQSVKAVSSRRFGPVPCSPDDTAFLICTVTSLITADQWPGS